MSRTRYTPWIPEIVKNDQNYGKYDFPDARFEKSKHGQNDGFWDFPDARFEKYQNGQNDGK